MILSILTENKGCAGLTCVGICLWLVCQYTSNELGHLDYNSPNWLDFVQSSYYPKKPLRIKCTPLIFLPMNHSWKSEFGMAIPGLQISSYQPFFLTCAFFLINTNVLWLLTDFLLQLLGGVCPQLFREIALSISPQQPGEYCQALLFCSLCYIPPPQKVMSFNICFPNINILQLICFFNPLFLPFS